MTLAILSKYSEPNSHLLTASHQTLVSCQYFGDNSLEAIDFSCIQSVVAMIPHKPPCSDGSGDHFFLVEKPGLDIARLSDDNASILSEE